VFYIVDFDASGSNLSSPLQANFSSTDSKVSLMYQIPTRIVFICIRAGHQQSQQQSQQQNHPHLSPQQNPVTRKFMGCSGFICNLFFVTI
jgi:hypothetical protein